jgi:hypothetical protein
MAVLNIVITAVRIEEDRGACVIITNNRPSTLLMAAIKRLTSIQPLSGPMNITSSSILMHACMHACTAMPANGIS